MKMFWGLIVALLLSACPLMRAQTDFKAQGDAYVAKGEYFDAKVQYEAALALLKSKSTNINDPAYIEIERLIHYADESLQNRRQVNDLMIGLSDEKILDAFSACSSEEEAEQTKASLSASLNRMQDALKKITGRFRTDRVSQAQLAGCDRIQSMIDACRNGFPEVLAWRNASETNTLAAYEAFLERYPNGVYADSAKKQIYGIEDLAAWNLAVQQNSLSGYRAYLAAFPQGINAEEAGRLAYAIGQEEEWDASRQKNTAAAYQDYIAKYPDSKYLDLAKAGLQMASEREFWENQETLNTVDAYNEYLRKYPEGRYVSDAQNRLDRIAEEVIWRQVEEDGSREAYEQYLLTSKLLAFKTDAELRIADIDHAAAILADEQAWERIANSDDPLDFVEYLAGLGFKGHADEARWREKLLRARQAEITTSTAASVISDYEAAMIYVPLNELDHERLMEAREIKAFAEFEAFPALVIADDYLNQFPDGSHAPQVADFVARTKADQMTIDVGEAEYQSALAYARTPAARRYVEDKYQSLVNERARLQRKMRREPVHVLLGVQGVALLVPEETAFDYGALFSIGGHSNRFNFELGYNFNTSSVIARPRLNVVKRNYQGRDFTGERRGVDYSKFYLYLAPEVKYYLNSAVPMDFEIEENASSFVPMAPLDYGVNVGFSFGVLDFSAGYFFPDRIFNISVSIYFGSK